MAVRVLGAAALFLLLSPGWAGAAPPDPAFLARIAAASGEPWRYHVVTHASSAERGRLVHTTIEAQGDRVLTRRCSGVVCAGSYVDGAGTALFSYNETPIEQIVRTDPRANAIRTIASYSFTSSSFRAAGGEVADEGTRPLGDALLRDLRVSVAGTTLDALIDPQTALLRAIADPGANPFVIFADQRGVGNTVLPFEIDPVGAPVEKIDERSIEPEPLRAPQGPKTTFASKPVEVPLARDTLAPRFPCRVENVPATCLLDTGASGLAMSLDLADRLHKTPIGEIELEGLGVLGSGVVRASSLHLGGLDVGDALYAILPDAAPFKADVVLGADIIGRCVVRLDLRERTIAFEPLGTEPRGTLLPLRFNGYTPTVPISLGDLPAEMAIDTGNESSIDLPIALYRAHPKLFVSRGVRGVAGVGGRGTQTVGQIPRVGIGSFTLQNVEIGATDVGYPTVPRLGAAFLSRFVVEFDYANARMGLATR